MPAIEVSHLTKEYRLGALQSAKQTLLNAGARLTGRKVEQPPLFKALDDVSFSIEPGEVVGIIGHNGAGKSTLLKMLARISNPTRGIVKVNGRIAPLIEVGAGFVPDFTGRENVYLNGSILGMSKKEIDKKFDEIVDFAEMAEFIDTPVKRYSSGMQVKLAFSVATSVESEILIVDEVLAVGDLAFQRKCFDRVESLIKREARTVLLVSHNLRQVQHLCSRGILLDHGRKIVDGITKDATTAYFEAADRVIAARQTNTSSAASHQVSKSNEIASLEVEIHSTTSDGKSRIEYRDALVVTMRISLNAPLVNPVISLGVHTTDLLYLTANSSDDRLAGDILSAGIHEVICELPDFPLSPGVYGIRASVVAGQIPVECFYGESLAHFSIETGLFPRVSHGGECFLIPKARWRFLRPEGAVSEAVAQKIGL